MNDRGLRVVAATGLVLGAVLGVAGTFAPSAPLRGLAWGLDGIGLVVASALLTIHYGRLGRDLVAAGFLVFAIGQGLVLSGAAMEPLASGPSFGAGAALWSAALVLIGLPRLFPVPLRILGLLAAVLFALLALQIFAGRPLSPLSTPLPFYAYPFLAATVLGWAWVLLRGAAPDRPVA